MLMKEVMKEKGMEKGRMEEGLVMKEEVTEKERVEEREMEIGEGMVMVAVGVMTIEKAAKPRTAKPTRSVS